MNITRPHGLLVAALVTGWGAAILPASAAGLEKGTIEIAPAAAFTHDSYSFEGEKLGSTTMLALSGNIGYCFTDRVEGEAGLVASHVSVSASGVDSGESASSTGVGLNGGLKINFPGSGDVVPFAAAGLGFLSYSGDGFSDAEIEVLAPIVQAGVRLLVGPTGSINLFAQYSHRINAGGEKDVSGNQFALGVGLSVFPGRK
jgi:hypothetical protein